MSHICGRVYATNPIAIIYTFTYVRHHRIETIYIRCYFDCDLLYTPLTTNDSNDFVPLTVWLRSVYSSIWPHAHTIFVVKARVALTSYFAFDFWVHFAMSFSKVLVFKKIIIIGQYSTRFNEWLTDWLIYEWIKLRASTKSCLQWPELVGTWIWSMHISVVYISQPDFFGNSLTYQAPGNVTIEEGKQVTYYDSVERNAQTCFHRFILLHFGIFFFCFGFFIVFFRSHFDCPRNVVSHGLW